MSGKLSRRKTGSYVSDCATYANIAYMCIVGCVPIIFVVVNNTVLINNVGGELRGVNLIPILQ